MQYLAGKSAAQSNTSSKISDAAFAVKQLAAAGWLFVADADFCLQPQLGIQRFIEGSIIADRMAIAITGHSNAVAGHTAQASVAGAATATAGKVVHLNELAPAGAAMSTESANEGHFWTVPLVAVPPAVTHSLATDNYAAALQQPGLGLDALAQQHSTQQPVMGYTVPLALGTRSLRELLLTDRFIAHWASKCAGDSAVSSHQCRCFAVHAADALQIYIVNCKHPQTQNPWMLLALLLQSLLVLHDFWTWMHQATRGIDGCAGRDACPREIFWRPRNLWRRRTVWCCAHRS